MGSLIKRFVRGGVLLMLPIFFLAGCSSDGGNSSEDTPTLTDVTVTAGSTTIAATGVTTLTASPTTKGSVSASDISYSWEISAEDSTTLSSSSKAQYASITGTETTATLTGKNSSSSEHTVTVKVTAKYGSTQKSTTINITVQAAKTPETSAITALSVTPESSSIETTGSTKITAKATTTGTVNVAYSWKITSGSDYATLSATSGESVTLTGKNTTTAEQTIEVEVTASDSTSGSTVASKTTKTSVKVAGKIVPPTGSFTLSYVKGDSDLSVELTSSSGGNYTFKATLPDSAEYTLSWYVDLEQQTSNNTSCSVSSLTSGTHAILVTATDTATGIVYTAQYELKVE